MNEEIISREQIAQEVRLAMTLGTAHICKYPAGTDAAAAWEAIRARLDAEEVQDSEGSA